LAINRWIAAAISSTCVSSAKWSRIKKLHNGIGIIATIRLGAGWDKKRIMLAPDRKQRRLGVAEILLECRIQREIRSVVEKEIELDVFIAGAL